MAGRTSHRVTTILGTSVTAKFTSKDWGDVATIQYPQIAGVGTARTVSYAYTNGWLTDVTGYATLSYWTNGMVNAIVHANGVTDTYGKDANDLARPASIATSGAASNWSSGTYQYDGAGNIVKVGADYYLYDKVSRVVVGAPRGATVNQQYAFDAFGNITQVTTNGSAYATASSASTNRLTAAVYDAAGNVTTYQGFTYAYDAFNQMRQLTGTGLNQYAFYAADGERVGFKDQLAGITTFTLRGLDGKPLREYSYNGATWSWARDYVWREGQALAVIDSAGTRHFALDHLGSVRLITNSDAGKTMWGYHAYYPFGEEANTAWDAERIKFTGHERDLHGSSATLDDLDYMHARYYKPVSAERFLSVDPVRGSRRAPQSFNLFAYVLGSPASYTDPFGLAINCGDGRASPRGGATSVVCTEQITVTGTSLKLDSPDKRFVSPGRLKLSTRRDYHGRGEGISPAPPASLARAATDYKNVSVCVGFALGGCGSWSTDRIGRRYFTLSASWGKSWLPVTISFVEGEFTRPTSAEELAGRLSGWGMNAGVGAVLGVNGYSSLSDFSVAFERSLVLGGQLGVSAGYTWGPW